jgi:hypothetical protein
MTNAAGCSPVVISLSPVSDVTWYTSIFIHFHMVMILDRLLFTAVVLVLW